MLLLFSLKCLLKHVFFFFFFQFKPTWMFCKKWKLSMRPSLVGRRTRLQPGNGTTSQSRHKTTFALSRTTSEFPVRCTQKTKTHIFFLMLQRHYKNTLYQLHGIVFILRNHLLKYRKYVFCSFIIFQSNFLFLSLSPFSQVGWCRKVQRVHDPDVLMAKPSHLNWSPMWNDVAPFHLLIMFFIT